jgi:tetratricopeptide (TPR) repeat protein/tRNA A-37 threonylcarbamoyl transferase component Bud32
MAAIAADRNLLFGLLALQNGLINQGQLVAAFQAWTLDKACAIADQLVGRGDLDADDRSAVDALVARHIKKHGGHVERSLAAIPAGRSTRAKLAGLGEPQIDASLAHVGSGSDETCTDSDRTASYSVGTATSDGQRFRILRPHAQGGLGAVFVALDGELHREVALKQILAKHSDDPLSRQRFVQEAEITGGLEHPGIVPVYGLGTYADGRPYYAMRFIRGDSLKEAIEHFHTDEALKKDTGRRSLELRKLLRRFQDVCNAIEYAHSRGVLHRDIKPGNIIVGRHGETLLVDWGLAKPLGSVEAGADSGERTLVPFSASGSASTLPGSALGTPAYMSPEQAEGDLERLGPRSDVYSLGATLYCLLTGKLPLEGDDIGALLRAAQRGEFLRPRQKEPSIDKGLEAVCLKAMALNPEDRYVTPRMLAEDIERWMADEPVSVWHEPLARRAQRWARRNRTAVAMAVVALVAGVAGLGAVAGVQARANLMLRRANDATRAALADTRAAKKATDAALALSEESRQHAETVGAFLVEAFRSPNPEQDGRQVKVVDVLDRAGERLDEEFSGSPATKGKLLDTLGTTYQGLGLYDKAVSLHAKARAVLETALGPDHPDTLRSRHNLAIAYDDAGQAAEAIALHESTLRLREEKLGPDHPDTLASRHNLATAYFAAGRTAEAIALFEKTLRLRESKLGPDHSDTLSTINNLAIVYYTSGRAADALALFEKVLKIKELKLGPDHPLTLASRHNLASAYHDAGRTVEAIALHEETLKLRESTLGPDHPHTLLSRDSLATAYQDAGRLSEAITLQEATIKLEEVKLGADHPQTLASRSNLAEAYQNSGRLTEAIAVFEAILKIRQTKLGPDHPETLESHNGLAAAYESLGRWAEAERHYREVLARRQNNVQPDSLLLANDLTALGLNLLMQSRWSEAEPQLRKALEIRAKAMPDDWRRYDAMSLLGGSLLGQGQYAEAEPLVVSGYEGMKQRVSRIIVPDRPRLGKAAARVIRLYEIWGKAEQAAIWKAKLGMSDLPADVFAAP